VHSSFWPSCYRVYSVYEYKRGNKGFRRVWKIELAE
jgi:hypothetical protein